MPTETRTFIGGGSSHPFDGWAGFRIGQSYQLSYTREFDKVHIVLDHHEYASLEVGPMVVTSEQFEKWFRK